MNRAEVQYYRKPNFFVEDSSKELKGEGAFFKKMKNYIKKEQDGVAKIYFHYKENILDNLKDIFIEKTEYFVDEYYDTKKYDLIGKKIWLKKRYTKESEYWNLKCTEIQEKWLSIEDYTFNSKRAFIEKLHFLKFKRRDLKCYATIFYHRKVVKHKKSNDLMYLESFSFDKKAYFLLGTIISTDKKNSFWSLIEGSVISPLRSKIIEYLYRNNKPIYNQKLLNEGYEDNYSTNKNPFFEENKSKKKLEMKIIQMKVVQILMKNFENKFLK